MAHHQRQEERATRVPSFWHADLGWTTDQNAAGTFPNPDGIGRARRCLQPHRHPSPAERPKAPPKTSDRDVDRVCGLDKGLGYRTGAPRPRSPPTAEPATRRAGFPIRSSPLPLRAPTSGCALLCHTTVRYRPGRGCGQSVSGLLRARRPIAAMAKLRNIQGPYARAGSLRPRWRRICTRPIRNCDDGQLPGTALCRATRLARTAGWFALLAGCRNPSTRTCTASARHTAAQRPAQAANLHRRPADRLL
jgi:hypothetical protein